MSDYGKILMSTANAVGASLKKKMGSLTGFAPVDWAETINKLGNKLPERTVSGAVCSFSDGADDVPMPSVKASITAVQAGSGDPSPSNVRAISGFTECDVTRAGKNLFDGIAILPYSGSFNSYYAEFSVNSTARKIPSVTLEEGKTYVLEIDITSDTEPFNISIGAGSGSYSKDVYTETGLSNGKHSISFTPTATNLSSGAILAIRAPRYSSSASRTFSVASMMLYEASKRTVIPVSFGGQTIYGGELNLTTGVLTVTHERVDMGSLSWTKSASYPVFFCSLGGMNTECNACCDIYLYAGTTTSAAGANGKGNYTLSVLTNDDRHRIYIRDDNYSTADDFTEAVDGHYLVYELTTPTTVQLTAEEVRSFLGTNNLWANTGDSEVTYFAQPNIPTEVLYKGQISTTSDYATANFSETVADDEEILVKVYCPARSAVDYKVIKVADIGNGLNVGISLHTTVNCTVTKTSIASYQYSGDHYDIYADVLAYDSAIFN